MSAGKLIGKTSKLIDIFADNTASDIHSTSALRRLLRLMLGVISKPIKQVKFHGRLGPSLRVPPRRRRSRRPCASSCTCKSEQGRRSSKQRKRDPQRPPRQEASAAPGVNLIDATATSRAQAADRRAARRLPGLLPAQARAGLVVRRGRAAHLHDRGTATASATAPTRWSSSPASSASTTACRAPRWHDPPILDSPSEDAHDRRPQVPALLQRRPPAAGRLEDRQRGSYWISNTLLQTLSASEMLGVARSLDRLARSM